MSNMIADFVQDPSGLWHHTSYGGVDVKDAADHACKNLSGRTAWFWHSNTFAPMLTGDTPAALVTRWRVWRNRFRENPYNVLDDLWTFATGDEIDRLD